MPTRTHLDHKKTRRALEKAVTAFELPGETVLGLPKVTLVGRLQIFIENHQGIKEYAPGRIRVRTTQGILVVEGRRLAIGRIATDEIVIEGEIEAVRFEEERGGVA